MGETVFIIAMRITVKGSVGEEKQTTLTKEKYLYYSC